MPILPLGHPKPFAATLGVMLYPGASESDARKARAFASGHLVDPPQRLRDAGRTRPAESLFATVMDSDQDFTDLDQRWERGLATGQLMTIFFAHYCMEPETASWNSAITTLDAVLHAQAGGYKAALGEAKREFHSVAHLWGAWCIRAGQVETHADGGCDGDADFESFLADSEILRDWGQTWRPRGKGSEPPLPLEVWSVPEGWSPQNGSRAGPRPVG
jgi:hypothetical protein